MIDARKVSALGIGFGSLAIATLGFVASNASSVDTVIPYYGGGASTGAAVKKDDRKLKQLARLHREDEEILAVIINAVTTGIIR